MKKLILVALTLISVSAYGQKFATYDPIYYDSNTKSYVIQKKEEPKEQVYRTTGYSIDYLGNVTRVSLKFTAQESYTGETLKVISYSTGDLWLSTSANVYKTGSGDPKDFGYKVGLAGVSGDVYFNY